MLIAGWDTPLKLLECELAQLEYEGWLVPQEAKDSFAELNPELDAFNEEKLSKVASALEKLSRNPGFNYAQPDSLDEIRRERPDGPRKLKLEMDDATLLDRLHGAWTGRAAGCALGKPVEGLGMAGHGGLNGRLSIKEYLKRRGHWELDYYFSGFDVGDGVKLGCPSSWRENLAYMEPDDDIHYSLIGLKVLEERGPGFEWFDVANAWNSSLPYNAICTAETQAILNYNIDTPRRLACNGKRPPASSPERTRRRNNPYREWIGAQIRADGWAYCCAGNPELAAEFAWRDAHWTHTANGIYGEMFVAAMIAAAFVESDPRKIIETGLSEIPRRCRLAEDLRWTLETAPTCPGFEPFMEKAEKQFAGMSPAHTNNNAVIVAMALLYGRMDPDRSICVSVMGGLDTDCNGATAGSIVGASVGRKSFGGRLAEPLSDTVKPLVFGFQETAMRELAERSLRMGKEVARWASQRD